MNGIKIAKQLSKSFGRHRPFTLKSLKQGERWLLYIEPSAKAIDDWRYRLAHSLWVFARPFPEGSNSEWELIFDPQY